MVKLTRLIFYMDNNGRGERIRTSGLTVPNGTRYQAAPHPDACESRISEGTCVSSGRHIKV